MSKSEVLHELYKECQSLDFMDTRDLVKQAETEDEADFIRLITDYILQRKQRRVVAEKRF